MEWLRPLYWKTLCLWRWGSGRICSHNARGDSFANTNIAINFFLCMSFRLWGPSHHTLARQAGVSRARCQKSRGLDDVLFRTKKKETLLHWSQSLHSLAGLWGTEPSTIYLSSTHDFGEISEYPKIMGFPVKVSPIGQQSNTSYHGREKIDHTYRAQIMTNILKFIDNVNIFSLKRFHRCWDISPRWLIYWPQEGNFSIR